MCLMGLVVMKFRVCFPHMKCVAMLSSHILFRTHKDTSSCVSRTPLQLDWGDRMWKKYGSLFMLNFWGRLFIQLSLLFHGNSRGHVFLMQNLMRVPRGKLTKSQWCEHNCYLEVASWHSYQTKTGGGGAAIDCCSSSWSSPVYTEEDFFMTRKLLGKFVKQDKNHWLVSSYSKRQKQMSCRKKFG